MTKEKKVITISTLSNDQKLYTENVVNDMQLKIKRLQEENEGLKSLNDFNVQKIEVLKEENEQLKKRQITKNGFICDCEQNAKYKQALEEIRENLIKLDTNDEDDFCYEFSKLQSKIDEVLNDRN